MKQLTDVWTLETPTEMEASDDLQTIIEFALAHNRRAIRYLRKLWGGETWEAIKDKVGTEGSVWYVWWMDGVRQHLVNMKGR